MKYLHLFETQADRDAAADRLLPPWVAFVKENNQIGMHNDKTLTDMFNVQTKSVNVTENGSIEITPDAGYGSMSKVNVNVNVGGTPAPERPKWTGHADAEGLRAIGWTDEDIAYYQENGVNWDEEDDHLHLVSDDNKALYGVLTADNIADYKDRIVYLPKIDTSGKTYTTDMFNGCSTLVAIPQLDTSSVTRMDYMFPNCYALVSIPQLDTSKVTNMGYMFENCYALASIPQLDTSNVTIMNDMFRNCTSLVGIPKLNTEQVTRMATMFYNCYALVSIPQLDTSNVTNMTSMFNCCYNLASIPQLDTSKISREAFMNTIFKNCYSLTHVNLKNAKIACDLSDAKLLSKESLLYLINNEATTSAITIKLASYAHTRLANDPDIVAALANHPNITLSK